MINTQIQTRLIEAKLALLKIKQARVSFKHFVLYIYPHYILSEFSETIFKTVDTMIDNVIANREALKKNDHVEMPPHILCEAPPRHGKTFLWSVLLPCYWLGRFPNDKVIACSFGERLLIRNARDVKRILNMKVYHKLFGNPFIRSASLRKEEQKLHFDVFQGRYEGYTVGNSIVGGGAQLLIVDDPIKNMEAAHSKTQKDSVDDWFHNDAYSRLEGGWACVLMHQRWAVDDLAGRILERDQDNKWTRITFKAIQDDGSALIPSLVPLKYLLNLKNTVTNFEAMYQQQPSLQGGNIIKTSLFKRYDKLPEKFDNVYIVADTALKATEHSDYTVFMLFGFTSDKDYYIIDIMRAKLEAPELLNRALDYYNKYITQYTVSAFFIEDKASGTGLIQHLKDKRIPVSALLPIKDKFLRVNDILHKLQYTYVPKQASWLLDFITECEQFTANNNHSHDDQVDCLAYGLSEQCQVLDKSLNLTDDIVDILIQ